MAPNSVVLTAWVKHSVPKEQTCYKVYNTLSWLLLLSLCYLKPEPVCLLKIRLYYLAYILEQTRSWLGIYRHSLHLRTLCTKLNFLVTKETARKFWENGISTFCSTFVINFQCHFVWISTQNFFFNFLLKAHANSTHKAELWSPQGYPQTHLILLCYCCLNCHNYKNTVKLNIYFIFTSSVLSNKTNQIFKLKLSRRERC